MNKHYEIIELLGACDPGLEWLAEQDNTWYDQCERGDWLAWLVAGICDRKRVVLCLCDIAESVQKYDGSGKGQIAIDTARSWCNGEATLEEVKVAAGDAALAAANARARAAHAAAYATRAAANAARATYVDNAAYAANAAGDAAFAAARAARTSYAVHAADYAADAARAAARAESLKQFANIIREHFPWSEVEAKLDELTKGVE